MNKDVEKENKKLAIYFNDEEDDDIIIIKNKVNKKLTKLMNKNINLEFIQQRMKSVKEINENEQNERQKVIYEEFENYYKRLIWEIKI